MSQLRESIVVGSVSATGALNAFGEIEFSAAHQLRAPHFTSILAVVDDKGNLVLAQRTLDAPSYPGALDLLGGHVKANKEARDDQSLRCWIRETALAEANEEMSIVTPQGKSRMVLSGDLKRFSAYGELVVNNERNVEFSTGFATFLRPGEEVQYRDENARGELTERPTVFVPIDEIAGRYAENPSGFADGGGRLFKRFQDIDDPVRLAFMGRLRDNEAGSRLRICERLAATLKQMSQYRTWEGEAAAQIMKSGRPTVLQLVKRLRDSQVNVRIVTMQLIADVLAELSKDERDLAIQEVEALTTDDRGNEYASPFQCEDAELVVVSDVAKEILSRLEGQ